MTVSPVRAQWHCGMSCDAHLPVNRGFTSSFGYLSGAEDHFADTRTAAGFPGVDFWRSFGPVRHIAPFDPRDRILPQSEVIRAIFLEDSPYCGGSQRTRQPPPPLGRIPSKLS